MENFIFHSPTKIIFGRNTESQAGDFCREYGATKVLLHYGSGSVLRSGLLGRIKASLEAAGLAYVELGGVVPNPRLALVQEGIALCRRESVDFLLAVGGGSVIDSAKAIGYGVPYEGDVWALFERKDEPRRSLPLGSVLTIAAAGSESSNSCVITNQDGWKKRGLGHELSRPRFAILNPELTFSLPAYQTACGCVDILMHTMERYFAPSKNHELTDRLSEGLLRTVLHNARILHEHPEDYNARSEVMWAGSLSHNGLMACGVGGRGDWACHQLEHELSGMFDVAHGAGLAAVWGSWARYVYPKHVDRFCDFATHVMGLPLDQQRPEQTALAGIEALEDFFRSIDMPVCIRDMHITLDDDQLDTLAYKCSYEGSRTIGDLEILHQSDMRAIYQMAR